MKKKKIARNSLYLSFSFLTIIFSLKMNSPAPFAVNDLFRDWSVLQSHIEEWAVKDHFAFKVRTKDYRRADYICRTPECQWRVFASHNRNGEIQLKIMNERHTCIGRASSIREVYNTQS